LRLCLVFKPVFKPVFKVLLTILEHTISQVITSSCPGVQLHCSKNDKNKSFPFSPDELRGD